MSIGEKIDNSFGKFLKNFPLRFLREKSQSFQRLMASRGKNLETVEKTLADIAHLKTLKLPSPWPALLDKFERNGNTLLSEIGEIPTTDKHSFYEGSYELVSSLNNRINIQEESIEILSNALGGSGTKLNLNSVVSPPDNEEWIYSTDKLAAANIILLHLNQDAIYQEFSIRIPSFPCLLKWLGIQHVSLETKLAEITVLSKSPKNAALSACMWLWCEQVTYHLELLKCLLNSQNDCGNKSNMPTSAANAKELKEAEEEDDRSVFKACIEMSNASSALNNPAQHSEPEVVQWDVFISGCDWPTLYVLLLNGVRNRSRGLLKRLLDRTRDIEIIETFNSTLVKDARNIVGGDGGQSQRQAQEQKVQNTSNLKIE